MLNFSIQIDQGKFRITCPSPLPNELKGIDLTSPSLDLIKKLAALGKISFEGRSLIVDLFSKTLFSYEVLKNNGKLELHGKIALKTAFAPSECKWIAPTQPAWIIYENLLRVIHTDISGKRLQNLPRIIDKEELEELLQEEIPVKICFEGALQNDPIPILVLTDRRGAFANLAMDYGDGKGTPFSGRPEEKYWEKDLLETSFLKKAVDKSQYYCPLDKVGKSLAFLLELGWKVRDYKGNEVLLETKRELSLESYRDQIALKGRLTFGSFTADLNQVLGSFNKQERFIELGNGAVGLNLDPLPEVFEEVETVDSHITLKRHHIGLLEESSWQYSGDLKPRIDTLNPSSAFQGLLRPYQQKGLAWLEQLRSCHLHGILADDMGLGKTIQVLAFLSLRDPSEKHLVVVPTSLLFNWEREVQKFLPNIPCKRHHGTDRGWSLPESGIILTSYNTIRNDLALFQTPFWDSIILDEAQVVKNASSLSAKALYTLKSRFRLAMTGTVIENHAKELFAHFYFLMPGMLGTLEDFERQISLSQSDNRYAKKIQKMIRPFILRRKKEEVAKDLPSLEEQVVFVEMASAQQTAYDTFLSTSKKGLLKKNRMEIFEILLRLRQITCSPLLVSHLLPEPIAESGKLEALFLDLETIREEGKKALVFSQFASMLHLIGKKLQEDNIPYCLLEGATIDREKPVTQFQEDPNIPFFLISLKAGGVGLNLTAADYVLLYDPWWHEAAESQAISRAHRIGQTKPVIAKRYITACSVEEKMLKLKKAKSALFQDLLEGDLTGPALTEEDLDFLLA
jgi:SNF2 family DNA or RNA helicase